MQSDAEEDVVDIVLRCGLYFGAIFQMICIAAVFILPEISNNGNPFWRDTDSEDDMSDPGSPMESPKKPQAHHKAKKAEKKKRR